jgi:Protein of unknown function (DUF2905)
MPASFQFGKVMVVAGVALVAIGLVVMWGSRYSWFGLGRLPGDIHYQGKHSSFYFPIVTCLVLSAIVTLIFWLISLFSRR